MKNIDDILTAVEAIIQVDVGQRGFARDAEANLLTATRGDFIQACRSIAEHPRPAVGLVTGFMIPKAQPPAPETDGPLGTLYLAMCLTHLSIPCQILAEPQTLNAFDTLDENLLNASFLGTLPVPMSAPATILGHWLDRWPLQPKDVMPSHLIAIERAGPSHHPASIQQQSADHPEIEALFRLEVPPESWNRLHTMAGVDLPAWMSTAEFVDDTLKARFGITTIGIGDGGNEIGMGKVPWDIIRRNIPHGAKVACRVPTDYLIVAGISNWGAMGLGLGVLLLRLGFVPDTFFDAQQQRLLLQTLVEQGGLVDGVTGQRTVSVDGFDFDRYWEPMHHIARLLRQSP